MIIKKYKILSLVIFFILMFCVTPFISCDDDQDDILPEISISLPLQNTVFHVYDTILVQAYVHDETKLESIRITLVDEDLKPASGSINISPSVNTTSISELYPINDFFMESGVYYILVRAYDGINTKSMYQKIIIYGIPKKLNYLALISHNNINELQIEKLDSQLFINHMFDYYGNFGSSAVSSDLQQLYICGKTSGNMDVYNLDNKQLNWSIPAINTPQSTYFTNLYYNENTIYVSFYDEYVKGYNNDGQATYSSILTNMYPVKLHKHEDYMIVSQQSVNITDNGAIGLYYFSTGMLKQSWSTNIKVVEMFSKDMDEVVIFGNVNSDGKVLIYNIENNNSWTAANPGSEIYDVCQIDSKTYLLACENDIKLYQYQSNSITTYISGISAKNLKIDKINGNLYIGEDYKISIYEAFYPTPNFLNSKDLSNRLFDFQFVYNKD